LPDLCFHIFKTPHLRTRGLFSGIAGGSFPVDKKICSFVASSQLQSVLLAEWEREFSSVSSREYTTGFLFEDNEALLPLKGPAPALARYPGTVAERQGDCYLCRSSNRIAPGMPLEIIGPRMRLERGFSYYASG